MERNEKYTKLKKVNIDKVDSSEVRSDTLLLKLGLLLLLLQPHNKRHLDTALAPFHNHTFTPFTPPRYDFLPPLFPLNNYR
jgi:hypothetical protein